MFKPPDWKHFSRSIALLGIALTSVAGFVDAIGYLNLGDVYVANMSGNRIAIGIPAAQGNVGEVWRFGWPVISFTFGLLLSRFVINRGIECNWRSIAAQAM
jgi:uncharacterized membrane protein YoaK (UPF0700 family)